MKPRLLVTGATGYVGGAVARQLCATWRVRALCRSPEGAAARALAALGVEVVPGDLAASASFAAAVAGVEAVVHAATDTVMADRALAHRVGVDASRALYEAAAAAGARRFVFLSSMAVYAGYDGARPHEGLALAPSGDVYADLKLEAEAALAAARQRWPGTGLTVLRLPSVFGPGSPRWTEAPLAQARAGRLVLPGGGRFAFPYVYVDDAVAAVARALEVEAGGTFDVFGGVTSFGDFMGHYARMAGTAPRSVPLGLLGLLAWAGEVRSRLLGGYSPLSRRAVRRMGRPLGAVEDYLPARAMAALGWAPAVSLAEGMRRVAASLGAC